MDEFLGSIEFNQDGDLLVSSSYLTYQHWTGFVAYLNSKDVVLRAKNDSPLMLSSLEINKSLGSGVCAAKWAGQNRIIIGNESGEIIFFKLNLESNDNKFENLAIRHEHDSLVLCLDCKLDSNQALSGSEDSRIKIWDLNEQLSTRTYKAHDFAVCSLTYCPHESKSFISTSQDGKALIWDTRKEKPAFLIKHGLIGYPSCSNWSTSDSNIIALGSETGQLGIYDLRMLNDRPFCISKIHKRLIRQAKFSKNSNLISTASEDCTSKALRIVPSSVTNESGLQTLYTYKHQDYVTDIEWLPGNDLEYLTCSWDGFIKTHTVSLKTQNGF